MPFGTEEAQATTKYCSISKHNGSTCQSRVFQHLLAWWKQRPQQSIVVPLGKEEAKATTEYCNIFKHSGNRDHCRVLHCLLAWWKHRPKQRIAMHLGTEEAQVKAEYCRASWHDSGSSWACSQVLQYLLFLAQKSGTEWKKETEIKESETEKHWERQKRKTGWARLRNRKKERDKETEIVTDIMRQKQRERHTRNWVLQYIPLQQKQR